MKNNKVWLLHIPRLNDQLTNGIKEVANIILKNNVDFEILDINHEIYKEYFIKKIRKLGPIDASRLESLNSLFIIKYLLFLLLFYIKTSMLPCRQLCLHDFLLFQFPI